MAAKKRKPNAGSFKPGHAGGPGRPPKDVERAYLDATYAAVSVDDWSAIVAKAVEDARKGDAAARTWLKNLLIPNGAGDAFEALLKAIA